MAHCPRLSCNDLKLHGLRAGNKYQEDGFQMMKVSDAQYLPIYCDMTTAKGAFTLIVTSAHNNWTRAQVSRRWRSKRNSLQQFYLSIHLNPSIISNFISLQELLIRTIQCFFTTIMFSNNTVSLNSVMLFQNWRERLSKSSSHYQNNDMTTQTT